MNNSSDVSTIPPKGSIAPIDTELETGILVKTSKK